MKCPVCGLEMVIFGVQWDGAGKEDVLYSCRNKRCPQFDKRLEKEKTDESGG